MSTLPIIANRVKHMTMGLGIFLIIFSVSMLFFIGTYTISILLAGIFFLMGVFGVAAGSRIKAPAIPTGTSAQKVVVEVRCKSCNSLNPETSQYCAGCGAHL
jgi:hypothetical protein